MKKIKGKAHGKEGKEMEEETGQEYFSNIGENGEALEAPTMYRAIGNIILKVPAGEAAKAEEESGDRWENVIAAMERAVKGKGQTFRKGKKAGKGSKAKRAGRDIRTGLPAGRYDQ